jgi:hypothetical protein
MKWQPALGRALLLLIGVHQLGFLHQPEGRNQLHLLYYQGPALPRRLLLMLGWYMGNSLLH